MLSLLCENEKEGPNILFLSQSWKPWTSLLLPRPVRRSSARQWRPVLLASPRRESTITFHRVQLEPPAEYCTHQYRNKNFILEEMKRCRAMLCTFRAVDLCICTVYTQILPCGLSGRWTTGWTGARLSLVSTAWAQTWEACRVLSCVVWTEMLSWAWCPTALRGRSCGNIWRQWGEVKTFFQPKTDFFKLTFPPSFFINHCLWNNNNMEPKNVVIWI